MRGRNRTVAVSGMVALLVGALLIPGPQASAQTSDLTIQVSSPFAVGQNCNPETLKGCRTGESMRFLAPTLKVHKGDTLTFDFAGFHTATLLPVGQDALTFRSGSAGGVGKPYSLFIQDPDDTTAEGATPDKPAVKLNPITDRTSVGGAPADCGAADNPCAYDGTQVVNSGTPGFGPPPVTFSATINANPGQSFWIICLIHTHMFLRVNVVADNEVATTQPDVDAAKAAAIATDLEWARSTDAQNINQQSSHTTASGQKVYDVYAGQESHFAALNGFYPKRTVVPKGATVRYHWSDLVYEDHTVTLPAPSAFSLFEDFFSLMCDPDTDTGAGPDTAGNQDAGPPCENPSQLEIDLPSRTFWGFGDGVFRGQSDMEHSGFRGAQFRNDHMDVKFTARSTKRGWKFFCMLHPMQGRVVVKPVL